MTTKAEWTNTANITKEIDINAQPQVIYDILEKPENLPRLVPEVQGVQRAGNNNYSAKYTVRVGGIAPLGFPITYYVTADQSPRQVTLHFNGNVEGQIRYTLELRGNYTHVVAQANYKFARKVIDGAIPGSGGLMGGIAQAMSSGADSVVGNLMTESQNDLEQALQNLKNICETKQ